METKKMLAIYVLVLVMVVCIAEIGLAKKPVGSAFTYTGMLAHHGKKVDDVCDFQCTLWDDPCACDPCAVDDPNQVGDPLNFDEVEVVNGKFTLRLDFGNDPNIFNGERRWLQLGMRAGHLDDPNKYTIFGPRTELTAAPYAVNAVRISGQKVVKSEHLGDKAVDPNKIAERAVRREHIEDAAVDPNKIADEAVEPNKIAEKAVRKEHLKEGIVDANKLGDISGYVLETSYTGAMVRLKNQEYENDYPIILLETLGDGGGLAVYDHRNSPGSSGVYGQSDHGIGVHGRSDDSEDISCGVYGENTAGGWAGYFDGNTCIDGQIKITGGLPGEGKVLTSDEDGLASWRQVGDGDSDWIISESNMYSAVTGNVGIGTDSPEEKLHLENNSGPIYALIRSTYGGPPGNGSAGLILDKYIGNDDAVIDYRKTGDSFWYAGMLAGPTGDAFRIKDVVNDKDIIFIEANNSYENLLYLDSAGKVGIRKTDPAYELDVNGDIGCVTLHQSSDERLKTEIRQLTGVLDKLEDVRGVSFEWNEIAESVGASRGEKHIGVIAQEIETVFPELVSTPPEGYKSVDYTKLTAVLIEAVKELKAENESLKQRIEVLERSVPGNQVLDLKEAAK